ncbi:MAG: SusC/RagA family TonB-linked outer membrane protein [Bacteroidales bacterium]|nr:SusC/RagA family TonB-linked outer membrane protein [Bacteroidales bacterium]
MRNSILRKIGILPLLLFGFAISFAFGQERTITGNVTSEEEGAIPGVNIVIQGTTQGTVTDMDGNYSLVVPGSDAVLVFSSIGFVTQTVNVGSQSTIDVVLVADVTALDEILIIGYGTQKKKETTSSITSVKSDEFNQGYVNNPAQLIQGKVAGLSLSKAGGDPNEGYNIRLRGMSTIGANTQPLFVIDGVPGASLDNVDPNDIESMDVLKDGSAAAIYGTRGSSGVIIIATKKGRKGTAHIDYNGYVTSEMVAKTTNVMNATEWRALSAETGLGTDFGGDTDWFKEITQNALSQVHNLAMSGGTDKTSYRASFNYRDADGIMLNSGFSQLNARINLTQKALNDRLTLDFNLGATQRESQYGFTDAFRYATIYNPTAPVRSDDAAYDIYDGYFNQVLFDYYNPVQILEQNINEGTDKRVNLSLKGAYEIMDGLILDAFYSIQNENFTRGQYYDKNSYWTGMDNNGMAERRQDNAYNQLFETTAKWNGEITSSVNLNVLGGYSYQDFIYEGFHARGGDFITDAFTYNNLEAALDFNNGLGEVESYKNSNKLIAFFGRVNVNVSDMWFVTASARYEGSSRFGADNRWGLFPAVGAGAELADFIGASFIDNLKFRVNYGITGNQPSDSYLSLLRLGPGGNFFYNGEFVPGYTPVSNANSDLRWEKKGEFDIGFDYSFLESKLFGSFDFYTRTTTDLLFEYQVPVPPNLYDHAWLNLGEIKSSGLELALTYNAVEETDFSYSLSFTSSYSLENTLVSLSGSFNGADLEYGVRYLGNMGSPGQNQVPLIKAEEGEPFGQLYAHTFVEIDDGGNLILLDTNGDGTVDPDDRQVVGNGLPDFQFGLGNNFTYKNWDLNVYFRGVFGHDLNNTYRAFYEVPNMITSYNLPKTATDMRSSSGTLLNNSSGVLSSYHIENASFVSLDNMSLGYNFDLPESSGFRNIRVYLSGNNLFYITGYDGVDPNPRYADNATDQGTHNNPLVPGIDRRNTWFRTRSVSFGVNIGF